MIVYHVTLLSNFAKAYDKYARVYDKSKIEKAKYPGMMFVLPEEELSVGFNKVAGLINRLGTDDRILVMCGEVDETLIRPNDKTGTGIGQYIEGNIFPVKSVQIDFSKVSIEEAYSESLEMQGGFVSYNELTPRSLSWLPVGQACQAKCKFCFSEASVSYEQSGKSISTDHLPAIMEEAASRGASRFVITGGGEPTLANHAAIVSAIEMSDEIFQKTILITNGIQLAKDENKIWDYEKAGLDTLAISRHHWDNAINTFIMGVDTRTEVVLEQALDTLIDIRLICVLQKAGVSTVNDVVDYVEWAMSNQVDEVCFKELYVSSTRESVYAGMEENRYSEENQVPLSVVLDAMKQMGGYQVGELPWGAPVFEVYRHGLKIKVAAYTEPSMYWERKNSLARSWNIMQDGTVLASLEDPASLIEIGE